jgi:hypothetical protein
MGRNRNSYILVGKVEVNLPPEGCGLIQENINKMDHRDVMMWTASTVVWLRDQ